MSSVKQLKKFVKTREYKERSQPQARAKLGFLEKKQDYKIRAKDFHRKEDTIQKLRQKAALRNPDEFYFNMNKAKTVKGHHVLERGKNRSHEERLKIKEQDLNFLNMKGQAEKKKIEQMQSSLQLLDEDVAEQAPRKHVIFAETEEEARAFDPCKHFNTIPELLHRSYNRLTTDQLGNDVILNKKEFGLMTRADKARKRSYEELSQHLEREEMVKNTEKKLRTHKMLMGKGRRVKIVTKDEFGDEIKSKTVYKFKTERKR